MQQKEKSLRNAYAYMILQILVYRSLSHLMIFGIFVIDVIPITPTTNARQNASSSVDITSTTAQC